jgi:putative toxin-antitoxin system antitoxin component (TIGR02293 family)
MNPVLRRLQEAMNAKQRRDPPPDSEANEWITVFEDVDDDHGNTIKRGVPVWVPKAEYLEFQRLRFNLQPEQGTADHATRVLSVQAQAGDVFEDPARAMQWMLCPHPELDGRSPLDASSTQSGYDRVCALLTRFAHGIGV